METDDIKKYNNLLDGKSLEGVISWTAEFFGPDKITFSSSMSAEDQVLTDAISRSGFPIRIFTLDTGRLPAETLDLIEATNRRYGIEIDVVTPDKRGVEAMVKEYGEDLFYESLEKRKHCCYVRKVVPLKKQLKGYSAWITGIRRDQAVTRKEAGKIEIDGSFDIIKINPLADWTEKEVWDYIKEKDVPVSALYEKGYRSIGCAPCTRAIKTGEDIRSGRWWWEPAEHKECGLHIKNGKIERKK